MSEQAWAPPEHGPDVTELLVAEHRSLIGDLEQVRAMRPAKARRAAFEKVAARLAAHEAAEVVALHPVLIQLPGGRELRDEAADEERQAAHEVQRILRKMFWRPGAYSVGSRLTALQESLSRHAEFEEREILPLLASCESEHKRQMIGAWIENAEALAPTRPHPRMPRRPGVLMVLGPGVAIADKLRDKVRKWLEP